MDEFTQTTDELEKYADQRREGSQALAAGTVTQADLAQRFNVSQSRVSRLAEKASPRPARPPALDADTERATRAFMRRLESHYPVQEGILYGSRARGTHMPNSDADIAVVLKGERGNRFRFSNDMAAIAFDVMMETGVMVQAVPLWEEELKRPDTFSNPTLIENIRRDGLRL